jgi:hypothetical protein
MPESLRLVRTALADVADAFQTYQGYVGASLDLESDDPDRLSAAEAAADRLLSLVSRVLRQDSEVQRLETKVNGGAARIGDLIRRAWKAEQSFRRLDNRHERLVARITHLVDGIQSGRMFAMTPHMIAEDLVLMVLDAPDFADEHVYDYEGDE